MIPNGVQAIEFRNRVVDTNIATEKGSIYVGTGMTSTIGGNTVYTVETVNLSSVAVGLQSNSVKLPIYTGAGNTGMVFATAANLTVGRAERAEKLGSASSFAAYSVGSSGVPVYFSNGEPVTCTTNSMRVGYATQAGTANSANHAAKADMANTATRANYAAKADMANTATRANYALGLVGPVGGLTTPVYVQINGSLAPCTDYANASVNKATHLIPKRYQPPFTPANTGSVDLSTKFGSDQQLVILFEATDGTSKTFGEVLMYYPIAGDSRVRFDMSYSGVNYWVHFILDNNGTLSWTSSHTSVKISALRCALLWSSVQAI